MHKAWSIFGLVAWSCGDVHDHPLEPVTHQDAGEQLLAPLPDPVSADRSAEGGICHPFSPGDLAAPAVRLYGRELQHKIPLEFTGTIEGFEAPSSEELIPSLGTDHGQLRMIPAEPNASRIIKLTSADGNVRILVPKLRTLGLRAGQEVRCVAETDLRDFFPGEYKLALYSGTQLLFQYVHVYGLDHVVLPPGVQLAAAEELCEQGEVCGGIIKSLRFSDDRDQSVVIEPQQGRSLGDYDVYVWRSIFREAGRPVGSGSDCPRPGEDTIELIAARRVDALHD